MFRQQICRVTWRGRKQKINHNNICNSHNGGTEQMNKPTFEGLQILRNYICRFKPLIAEIL